MKTWKSTALLGLLLVGHASAQAEEIIEVEGQRYSVVRTQVETVKLRPELPEFDFCPLTCYTDQVQRSVIQCRAPNGEVGEGPVLDDRGEFVGSVPRWSISETHDLREISVFEKNCQRSERETVTTVLGAQPQYFPGDPNILDSRTRQQLGLAPFDCNSLPAEVDPNTGDLVAELQIDLLIARQYLVCH